MTFRATVILVVTIGIGIALYSWNQDPHDTRLPFGTADLTSVKSQLAKLPKDERALVEAYVERSRGDVLPKQFADPDNPLTARTFGAAIELQREWEKKQQAMQARMNELHAAREAKLEPLRAVVQASVVKAEIVTRNEYQARRDPTFYQRPYQIDKSPAFITQIRIQNLSDDTIVSVRGSLHVEDKEAYLPMDLCWLDIGNQLPIPSGGSIEVTCGHDFRQASQQQRDFIENAGGRFRVVWEPRDVKFASGRALASGL